MFSKETNCVMWLISIDNGHTVYLIDCYQARNKTHPTAQSGCGLTEILLKVNQQPLIDYFSNFFCCVLASWTVSWFTQNCVKVSDNCTVFLKQTRSYDFLVSPSLYRGQMWFLQYHRDIHESQQVWKHFEILLKKCFFIAAFVLSFIHSFHTVEIQIRA